MTYSHIKERAEFWALVRDHGAENVQWKSRVKGKAMWPANWVPARSEPRWLDSDDYMFRVKPRKTVMPEAELPEEDEDGEYQFMLRVYDGGNFRDVFCCRYAAAEDRDKVVAAMLDRRVR